MLNWYFLPGTECILTAKAVIPQFPPICEPPNVQTSSRVAFRKRVTSAPDNREVELWLWRNWRIGLGSRLPCKVWKVQQILPLFKNSFFCACLFGHESLILRTVRIRLLWGDRGARSRGWWRLKLTAVAPHCVPFQLLEEEEEREREGPTMTIQAAWCRCNASPVAIHEYLPTFGNLQPDYWNSTAGAWVLGTYKYIYQQVRYKIMKHLRHKICVWVIHHIKWALF